MNFARMIFIFLTLVLASIMISGCSEVTTRGSSPQKWQLISTAPKLNTYPKWTADGTRIAFLGQKTEKEGFTLLTMKVDGLELANIFPSSGNNNIGIGTGSPAWSPDGSKIAFAGFDKGNNRIIYVINADGSGLTNLTSGLGSISWSPDGSKIVFHDGQQGNGGIYVISMDGTGRTQLTRNSSDGEPAWSPDGSRIAFSSSTNSKEDLYIMNADGSSRTKLTNNSAGVYFSQPSWSPDGQKITFSADSAIFIMNIDGSGQTRITSQNDNCFFPDWSPDGTKIAFSHSNIRGNGYTDIYVMNVDGSELKSLTNNP